MFWRPAFLERGDVPALKALLSQHDEDCTAQWRYTQALVAFREGDPAADKIAEQAWCANNHVPALLSGTRKALPPVGDYITIGGEDEAAIMSRKMVRLGRARRERSSG